MKIFTTYAKLLLLVLLLTIYVMVIRMIQDRSTVELRTLLKLQHRVNPLFQRRFFNKRKHVNITWWLQTKVKKLQKSLQIMKKKFILLKQAAGTEALLNTPVNKLAKVSYPDAPKVYQNRDILLCGRSTLKLLILTLSDHTDVNGRNTIRNTWGKLNMLSGGVKNDLRWRSLFLIGRPYEEAIKDIDFMNEVLFRHDILSIHADNSFAMSAFYGALHWAANGCSFEYLLIMKPNTFLNIRAMHGLLHQDKKIDKYFYARSETEEEKHTQLKLRKQKVWTQEGVASGAMIISYNLVHKLLPRLIIFINSNIRTTQPLIDSLVTSLPNRDKLGIKISNVEHLSTKTHCHLNKQYVFNIEFNNKCMQVLYDEYLLFDR